MFSYKRKKNFNSGKNYSKIKSTLTYKLKAEDIFGTNNGFKIVFQINKITTSSNLTFSK